MKDTGLTEKEWEQIRTVFRAVPAIEKAVLFGSRAMGLARGNSDVDIMLYGEELTMGDVAHARALLEETTLPYQFDLVLHDAENKTLQEHVRQYGKVIVGRVTQATDTPLWRKSTWGNEVRLEYGKALRDYDPHYGKFRVYGSNGPIGWAKTALADGPGVILGRKGAYRGVEYSREPFFVIDTAYYVVPLTEIDMRWLYYAIKHYKLGEIDDGSPIPSTTRSAVYTKSINVPPFLEQKQISHYLGIVDDRIQILRETNATLEAMAQALFKSWFVDFDPVHAKAEGRAPEGMDAETAALFPDEFEESELGMIPKGWKVERVNEHIELAYGKALTRDQRIDGPIVVIGSNGQIGLHNKGLVKGPGIVVGRKGNPGTVIWVDDDFFPIDTTFYIVQKSNTPLSFWKYALSEFNLPSLSADSAVPGLNRNFVYSKSLCTPSGDVLKAFDLIFQSIRCLIFNNCQLVHTLTSLRDTLLPRLISGKLRLPEFAEAADEEAMA